MKNLEDMDKEVQGFMGERFDTLDQLQKPDLNKRIFSGVTNKLEDIRNDIDLATNGGQQLQLTTSEHAGKDQSQRRRSIHSINQETTVPFEVFEKQIHHDMQHVQTETAKKVLKRFYRKIEYND